MKTQKDYKFGKYNMLNIKEGQKITFELNGQTYTRKVQIVYVQGNGITIYNVNKVGSGTGWEGVEPYQVIEIK